MLQYEQYKAINLPWLKDIPAHWSVQRNKTVFSEMKEEVGQNSEQYRLLSLTLNGIIHRDMEGGGKFPESFDKYKVVKQGYMAFCLFDVDETPRTVGLSQYDGMLTGAYTIMQVHDINPRYAYYYYLSLDNQKKLRPLYTGLRKTINVNTFQSIKLPIPPRDEQEKIVRFLDWKVSAINRLINLRRKEITALEDLKRSIIHHAVTHGIKPNVPMKDSGVQWIGKIPEHWKVFPMYAIAHQKKICNCTELPLLSVYLDLGVIPFSQKEEKRTNTTSIDLSKYQRVDVGDFVLNNQQAWRGSVGVSFDIGIVSPAYIVLSMNGKLTDCFANYLLRSRIMVNQYLVNSRGVGSIQRNLYWASLKRSYIPVPPMEEQLQIVDYIENRKETADRAIHALHGQIENLQDLKARLISDVVTGKIDVRGVEVPEVEFVDEAAGEEDFEVDNELFGISE